MIRLRELWVDGFGCLRTGPEPFRFEHQRITVFLDNNEAGKTTLLTAILASLYGLEADERRKHSERPHKAHWKPLADGPFGTRLRIHDGKRLLELRWDFAKGDLRIVDVGTNRLVTDEVCPGAPGLELGRRLLGVTFDEFLKTFLVRQDDLRRVRDPDGLDALIQRAADTQAGSGTAASAQDKLHALLEKYPGVTFKGGSGRIENEIARLEAAVAELEAQLKDLEAARAAVANDDAEYQRQVAEREALHREIATLDYLAQVAEFDELRSQIDDAQKRRAALAALEAERAELAPLQSFPIAAADELMQWQVNRLSLLHNAEQSERVIAEIRSSALEPARAELQKLGTLASATPDDQDAVQQLLGRTRDFEAREQRHRDALAREEAQLAAQGASVEDLDRLEEHFATLKPDDAEFLLDHDRAAARTASEIEEAKRRALEAQVQIERILAERARQGAASRRLLFAGAIIAAAAILAATPLLLLHWAAAITVAVAGAAAGAWTALRGHKGILAAQALQADQLAQAHREAADAEDRAARLADEQRERKQRLAALAKQCGYEQPEVLVEDHASLHDLRRQCGNLILLRTRDPEFADERAAIEAEVTALLARWAQPPPGPAGLSRALIALRDRMGASLRLRQRIADLTRKLEEETARRDALRRDAEATTARLRALFNSAGIPPELSIEQAITAFNELTHRFRRLRQLNDELIPQAKADIKDPRQIEAWRASAERLHRTIANMREERPDLLALQVKESASEYRDRRAAAALRADALRASADALGRRVVDTIARYQAEKPKLDDALAQRREELARARRHEAALRLAAQVLSDIAAKVHGQWAEELNRSATTILQRMAPSLTSLKFDNRLAFGVSHRALPEPIHSSQEAPILSAGTLDQLCLAVRLCIADFVGRRTAGGLLLLDDPFAHFDDPRFEAAMRILADLARNRHQIVLFSCQRQRFQWLRERDPRWFDSSLTIRPLRRP